VASLRLAGAPIDGVGLQSHFVAGHMPSDLRKVMEAFAALGVDVAVTELDVRVKTPPDPQSLAAQAADYAAVAGACRAVKRCVGVTAWGITDDHSWIPSFFSGYGAALPFDENYRPKPAYFATIDALTSPTPNPSP
jgi:endo-1,4-beta-xylanase